MPFLLAAFVCGALTAAVLVGTRRSPAEGLRVPMGPALIAGAFLGALLG